MKAIEFKDEASRLNVSQDVIKQTFRKALLQGNISGVIDQKNQALIVFEHDEIDALAVRLSSSKISIKILAQDLNLKVDQARLVIEKLLQEDKIQGVFTNDDAFISDFALRRLMIEAIQKNERMDIHELSAKLFIPEYAITSIIDGIKKQIINDSSTYSQISLTDLSAEIGLPETVAVTLLKKLVQERKLNGQLDMVNKIFINYRQPNQLNGDKKTEERKLAAEKTSYIEKVISDRKLAPRKYLAYFFMIFGFCDLFGGAWTYLTSVGTILEDVSAQAAVPFVISGIVLMIIGFAILPAETDSSPSES